MKLSQKWLVTDDAVSAPAATSELGCVGWYLGVPPSLRSVADAEGWTLPHVWTEEVEVADMDCTDAIVALIAANPSVVTIDLQVGYAVDAARLPAGVTCASWGEDWSEGLDDEGRLVVRFRA
jgi:hypothetical protein